MLEPGLVDALGCVPRQYQVLDIRWTYRLSVELVDSPVHDPILL